MRTPRGTSDQGAGHDHAVVLVCDAGYFPFALFLATEIARCHPDRAFDPVIVCSESVGLPPTLPAGDVRIVTAEGTTAFDHLPQSARRSRAAYLRLMLPELLPEYARIAYLDCDIAVAIPALDELLRLDLRGRAVGAVRDTAQWRTPSRRPKEMRALGRPSAPYFNSGVMLIDAARWREERIAARCSATGQDPALRTGLVRNDQSVINLAVEGRWCEISPVWNWQWTRSSRFFAETAGARLVHFIGPRKPWNCASVPACYTRAYRPFLERHFPDHPCAGVAAAPPSLRDLGRMLVRHRLRLSATQAFLDRFPDSGVTYAH